MEVQNVNRNQSPCVDSGRDQNSVCAQGVMLMCLGLTYYILSVSFRYVLAGHWDHVESIWELPRAFTMPSSDIIVTLTIIILNFLLIFLPYSTLSSHPKQPTFSQILEDELDKGDFLFFKILQLFYQNSYWSVV